MCDCSTAVVTMTSYSPHSTSKTSPGLGENGMALQQSHTDLQRCILLPPMHPLSIASGWISCRVQWSLGVGVSRATPIMQCAQCLSVHLCGVWGGRSNSLQGPTHPRLGVKESTKWPRKACPFRGVGYIHSQFCTRAW